MNGLNKQEIEYRIKNGLINNEKINNSRTIKEILYSNIITLFNIIHFVLFALVITTGQIANTFFVISIIMNTIIGIYQEIKAKKIIDNLKITSISKVKVKRENKEINILPTEILLDDLLILTPGDNLVVDAQIIESNNCEVDESIITGETNSIIKNKGEILLSGTIIISGTCYAKVTSINRNTYTNKLIKETSKVKDESSYIQKSLNSILKIISIIIIPIGIMLFTTQFFLSGQTYTESLLSSVAGVIGMIPDGLVLLTSIALTYGVIRMAKEKVIIQKLNGIELLSCVDVLCLDKTGTITDGTMEVIELIKLNKDINYEEIISNMLITPINVTDQALIKYFGQNTNLKVIEYQPFSSKNKYTKVKFSNGEYLLGALEYISKQQINEYHILKKYIDKGYRILTFAKHEKQENKILGFIIIKDNIRKNAHETIEYFKKQNVEIKVISGDNPQTICNLLKQIDFPNYNNYISGKELPEKYEELIEIVNKYTIFGRVTPYQKQQIIKALKEQNTVGMIGDGVNDILALKEANCGIALANGISAARSVSEVVLTDADFGLLPKIVNEGRRVVNNIERVASMYLIKTIYSFLISLICIFTKHEYPFYPIQLTLIGILCVGIPSFFLALEPNYKKVKKTFLINVFQKALPSGICVAINVLLIITITKIINIDYERLRIVVVATTGYLNLRLLYKVSIPLNKIRTTLLAFCFITYYVILIMLNDFILIKEYNLWSFILIIIICFTDNYLIGILETIYNKAIKYIYDIINKRSKQNETKKI